MAYKPSEVLRKTKRSLDDEHDTSKNKKTDKDDAKDSKTPRKNGLLLFIAKNKKAATK